MGKTLRSIAVSIACIFSIIASAYAAEIAVIVNATGPLVNISKSDIADIYLGEKRFHEGVKITPLLYPEGAVKEAFLRETVDMTPKEYKFYWTRKIFQEGIPIPKTVDFPAEIVNTVRGNEGAVGFLPKEALKDPSGVKVIKVIGR